MIKKMVAILAMGIAAPLAWADSAVDGDWDFAMSSPFGEVNAKVNMKVEDGKLTGGFDLGEGRVLEIEEGLVEGDKLSFSITRKGMMTMTYKMSASVDGDSVSGTAAAMGTTAPWAMTRSD